MLSLLNPPIPNSLTIHEKELSSYSIFHVFFILLCFLLMVGWYHQWSGYGWRKWDFFFICWKQSLILPFVLAEANLNLLNFYCCWWILGEWIFGGVQVVLWATYGGFYGENLVRECSRILVHVSIENVAEFSMLKRWI